MKIIKVLLVMLFIGVGLAEAIPIVNMEYTITSVGVSGNIITR